MLWNLCEKQFQILIGVNRIGPGCFYKAVKHGAGFCTIVGFHVNEVLSADGKRTDSLLTELSECSDKLPRTVFAR